MTVVIYSPEQALQRLKQLIQGNNDRIIIGIIGKPGVGKSTFSSFLMDNLITENAVLVPMDGFHLSNKCLVEEGKSNRKGALDTFDVYGFTALLRRIKSELTSNIYFPVFHREIEESIVAEGVVSKHCNIVITEGNYLLHTENGWEEVLPLLTESWYIQIDEKLRLERLIARGIKYGRSLKSARDWAYGSDEVNAKLVEKTKIRADVIIQM